MIQVHRFRLGRIELAVRHAGPRAHILQITRLDHRPVAHTVLVLQRTLEHIGDDLHVVVRVLRKASAARDSVIVHHPQRAELPMLGINVIGK